MTTAEVQVYNASDHRATFIAEPWRYSGGVWQRDPALGLFPTPDKFTLAPQQQRTISVIIPKLPADCTLVGVGFTVPVTPEGTGVAVQGVGIAQLAVNGKGGTEADCLAVIPQAALPPATTSARPYPLWIIAAGILMLAGWRLFVALKRRKPHGRHRPGFLPRKRQSAWY